MVGKKRTVNDQASADQVTADQSAVDQSKKSPDQQQADCQQQLEQLQLDLNQKDEAYKRVLADYQNLRRYMDQERSRLIQMAGSGVIESLLPVYDHLEMALNHFDDPSLKMIRDEFWQALANHGLEVIETKTGQEFDHETMEAVDTQPGQPNRVMQIAQTGYRLNGRVIRHSKVIVGKKKV